MKWNCRIVPRATGIFSLAFLLNISACVITLAQVNFIQVTDPHLYDEGDSSENKAALKAFVERTNELIAGGADYKFIVMTGDIGIEKLVKPLLGKKEEAVKRGASQEEIKRIDYDIGNNLKGAVQEFASILATSKFGLWLFLPGNNDLVDEKPDSINYYREFIKQLNVELPDKRIVDLCPTDDPNSGTFPWGDGYLFIGFNNASFKNNNDPARISTGESMADVVGRTDEPGQQATSKAPSSTTVEQLKYVQQVLDRIKRIGSRRAYILYHIPEVDDPHPILNFNLDLLTERQLIETNRYAVSSWYVDARVRRLWESAVTDQRVMGLFAGHYHDWRRDTYQDIHWMQTPYYSSGTLSKLYVCPPLAVKRQRDKSFQARGFQEVSIDGIGRVNVKVVWYDAASKSFESEAERQLTLGKIYEEEGQWKDAEGAYTKALDSESAQVRQRAIESIKRVVEENNSYRRKYFLTPFAATLERGATILINVAIPILLILLLWWLSNNYGKRSGKNRVEIEPFADSTENKLGTNFAKVFEIVCGVMQQHYRARGIIRGMSNVPMFARSQHANIAELAETVVPGGFGKAVAWVTRRMNQPEFSIRGSIQTDGTALTVIVILERSKETLGVWKENITLQAGGMTSLLDFEQVLAYKVLIFLKEYINQ